MMTLKSFVRKAAALAALLPHLAHAQDDLGIANGYIDIETPGFTAKIVRDAQVLVSLAPSGDTFDFLPYDLIDLRARNGQYHWGDITFRYRDAGSGGSWTDADSTSSRQAVEALAAEGDVLASADLSATLPDGPLSVTRQWLNVDGDLGLRFTLENTGSGAVEIGSLGFPAEFNSIFTGRTAVDMHNLCSLSDPYVGMDAGQIRIAPVKGTGAALVVTPLNDTSSPLEAYRNLDEPQVEGINHGSQTFEGFYEWQTLSLAWAEEDWASAEPWNTPTSRTLEAGESLQVGVRFSAAAGLRALDETVRGTGTPVAISAPGYILPRDQPAKLLLQSDSAVASITSSPEGALQAEEGSEAGLYTVTPSTSAWGRVRLTVEYEGGKVQTIHYYVTKATSDALADLGSFLTTEAWFTAEDDPFGRSPSVMTYDYGKGSIVDQDGRVWIAGLSDEGGTGAYVAAMVKQAIQPNAEEVIKLEQFVDSVIWGNIQNEDYGVKKSLFFYDPSAAPGYTYDESINWGSWTSWNQQASSTVDRAYNYVHVAAAYWSLYRVARAYPDTVTREWDWYLDQAQQTILRITGNDVSYSDVGLMGETVFGEILKDLEREGLTEKATAVEDAMRERAELWDSQEIPYGSEMAWDSTGQEGVFYWTRHFGMTESATKTINSVLGYTPNIPHWGYNGNSRRYWDFIYGGKLQRIERQIHHYGSGLNSQVLLGAFRDDPTDSYLLRVGYAGSTGPLSNINQDGFPSAAFHSRPETLAWDGITGDYGGGFLGMALNSGTYVAEDSDLGLVAYGGILSTDGGKSTVQVKDAVRRRFFIGPLSLLVSIDAGVIEQFSFDDAGSVSFTIAQQDGGLNATQAAVWVESTGGDTWTVGAGEEGRGGWVVPLSGPTTVDISRN